METNTILFIAIAAIVGILIGVLIANVLIKKATEKKAGGIIKDAEAKEEIIIQEKNLKAKEKFLQLKMEHEKVINEKNQNLLQAENKAKQKEQSLSQKQESVQRKETELDAIRQNLTHQLELVSNKQVEVDKFHKRQVEQLETLSSLSAEDAKSQLIESMKAEADIVPG